MFASLIFYNSLAQVNQSPVHWQEQTLKNPLDAQAWFNLGVLYEKGKGVTANQNKAQQTYSRAIELGYAPAMFNLGSIYAQKKDYTNAKFWWEKAAQKNVPEAQYNLATLYEKGWGVKQDAEKAVLWYQRAAETAMQKYMDRYQHSKEKLKQHSAVGKNNVSFWDQFSLIPAAVAATDAEQVIIEPSSNDQNTALLQLAQQGNDGEQQIGWSWVYLQPEENFTIQLFATKDKSKTEKFIQQYALANQAKMIPAIIKGTQYYKVILGSFSDWNDAAVEIGGLPQDLRDQRPWVRKFVSLYPEKPESVETAVSVIAQETEAQDAGNAVDEPEQVAEAGQVEVPQVDVLETAVDEQIKTTEAELKDSEQSLQSQQQYASLDKQQADKQLHKPEKTSADNGAVDDVFTLYAQRQLKSNGLPGEIKQQLKTGLEAIRAQDHASGYQQLAPLAEAGLPEAQFRLSLLYAEGKGVGLDLAQAFEYAKLSAEQGHPYGQRLLAEFYSNGVGTEANVGLATYWKQTADDNIKKLEEL